MDANQGNTAESFATYFARTLIARNGYQHGTVPEAAALAEQCDIILTRMDGMEFEIACLLDGETNPGKQFGLDAEALQKIGKDCLQYSGSVHRQKMPIKIRIFQIGPALDNAEHQARLRGFSSSLFSKVQLSSWIFDTEAKSVWTNTLLGGRLAGRRGYERLLREPRADIAELQPPPPVADAPESFPYVTYALLAFLLAVFGCELVFGIGDFTKLLEPSIATLEAMGGLSRASVFGDGEWFRLISATFLHADALHIALNGIVLFFAGRALEQIVGHAWFAAIYAVSAVCGSVMSLALLGQNIVSVGASGAIMGLLGAMLAISFRYPKGSTRTQLQMLAFQVLIPSLIPLAPAATGQQVDFGAHLGGALGGLLAGAAMLAVWSRQAPLPGLRWVASAVAAVWVAAGVMSLAPVTASHAKARQHLDLQALLMPNSEIPSDQADTLANAESLLARYPRDPRAHLYRAQSYLHQNDTVNAEKELRLALNEQQILKSYFNPGFENALRATLAVVLADAGRTEDAKKEAKPVCGKYQTEVESVREAFQRLCE